jgi:hypothetical protein
MAKNGRRKDRAALVEAASKRMEQPESGYPPPVGRCIANYVREYVTDLGDVMEIRDRLRSFEAAIRDLKRELAGIAR